MSETAATVAGPGPAEARGSGVPILTGTGQMTAVELLDATEGALLVLAEAAATVTP